MRIFIGIDLDPEVRARIERFLEGVEGFAPDARWVRPESLHITLKFIGEQTPEQVEAITERLRRVEGSAFEIRAARIWIFPDRKGSARILDRNSRRTATGGTGREHRRGDSRTRHSARRPALQPASDSGARWRREKIGLAEMAQRRRPQRNLRSARKAARSNGRA